MAETPVPPQPAAKTPPVKAPAAQATPAARPATAPAKAAVKRVPAKRPAAKVAARRAPAKPKVSLIQRMRSMRFRLLPITIFAAVLMLGVRIGDLWRLATHDATLPAIPATLAQQQPAAKDAAPAKDAAKPGAPADKPAGDAKPAADASGLPPPSVDNEELVKRYAERRADLDKRTKDVEMKEALLAATEKRVEQKVQEMEKIRAEIQQMMKSGEDKQNAQIDALVTIYEKMKPKEAARIFDEMDLPQLLEVVPRMKDTKSALVLAAMNPVKAKELTTALLAKRTQPTIPQ